MTKLNIAIALLAGILALMWCATPACAQGLVINEFMAINDTTLQDANSEYSDWLEIYNPGPEIIDVAGWYLTDNPGNLTKWQFPSQSISPDAYLVVFASGSTNSVIGDEFHASFKLSGDGEYLALVESNGITVAYEYSPSYPTQLVDVSYGILADRTSTGFFPEPTPGAENSTNGYGAIANEPIFSRTTSTFTNDFLLLSLSCTSVTATIRYTIDRSSPTEASAAYSSPLSITNSTQVRARVFDPGRLPSEIVTHTFIRVDADSHTFSSDIPIVIVDTLGQGEIPDDNSLLSHIGLLAVFETNATGRSSLSNGPSLWSRAAFSRRGESTLRPTGTKPNLAVETQRDDADLPRNVSLLDLPEESDWILYGPYSLDRSLIRNAFIFNLANQADFYAPRTRFVEVFLNAFDDTISYASDFAGLYVLMERIKKDKNRVDVETLSPGDIAEPEVSGGYVIKSDKYDPNSLGFMTSRGTPKPIYGNAPKFWFVYPKPDEVATEQFNWVTNYYEAFEEKLFGGDYDPMTGYAQYIDSDSFVDFWLLNLLMRNSECAFNSQFMYKARNGPLTMGPLWDFDRTSGSHDGRSTAYNLWDCSDGWAQWNGLMTGQWGYQLFKDPDYWQRWIDRWQSLRETTLSHTNIYETIERMHDAIEEAAPRHFARWTGVPPRTSWDWEIDHLQEWLSNRVDWIDSQLIDAVLISPDSGLVATGTTVSLTATEGDETYYTLDGSDPRLPGGGINPSAEVYGAAISILHNTTIRARQHDADWVSTYSEASSGTIITSTIPWSGITEKIYITEVPTISLSEVMYNPRSPGIGETGHDETSFEFVEIRNTGTHRAYLAGVNLSDGVEFDFSYGSLHYLEPGEHALVVASQSAFTNRYGTSFIGRVAGEFTGALNSGGERVTLELRPIGLVLSTAAYNDARGWPLAADGAGHSLVATEFDNQPTGSLNYGGNWRASTYMDGSPGEADPEPINDVLLNEIAAHTDYTNAAKPEYDSNDWMELYNTTTTGVSLADWYLSDSASDLKKWAIPATNTIAAEGWLAFDEVTGFHSPITNGFGLNKDGEQAFLSYLPGTTEDRVADCIRFKGQENGATLGRYSDGEDYWYTLTPTRDTTNMLASDHVVINQLMYHPAPTLANPEDNTNDEYIVLYNPTDTAIELWNDAGTWRIDGGVDYSFPSNTSIGATDYLTLVSFDPTNTTAMNAFQDAYSLTNGQLHILGPYADRLSNDGERIALERPQAPDVEGGDVSWVIVDEVIYSAHPPWPVHVQTNGMALQRAYSDRSGNDPFNWVAQPASLVSTKVFISNPAAGSTLYIPFSTTIITVIDDTQVSGSVHSVEFFLGTNSIAVDTTEPYETTLDYTHINTSGTYRLRADLLDDDGTESSVEIVFPAAMAERIEITHPADGTSYLSPLADTMTAAVDLSHVVGSVHQVRFYSGAIMLREDTISPYTCDLNQFNLPPTGNHQLSAVMEDDFGVTTSQTVNVFTYDSTYKEWDYRMQVSVSGNMVIQGLEAFPVLVKLHDGLTGFDYSQFASASGSDLRVTDVTGTNTLYHEIEDWDTNGTSCVWVQMPKLTDDGLSIWLYWGNDADTNSPGYATNGTVWTNGFDLVQHMSDDTGSISVYDSTSNNVQTTFKSSYSLEESGRIGRALGLTSISSAIQVSDPYVPLAESWTISTWFKGLYPTSQGRTLARTYSGDRAAIVEKASDNLGVQIGLDFTDSGYDLPVGSSNWHHLAVVGESGGTGFYVDGQFVGAATNQVSGSIQYIANTFSLFGGECFADLIDEFRIEGVARSANWIWTCWLNQGSNEVFSTYGASEENNPLAESPLDADGDGMLDEWEVGHFGSTNAPDGIATNDPDFDGMPNYDEFTAGTDPTNSNSVFWVDVSLSNNDVLIEFFGVDASAYGGSYERYYSLENATNLAGGWSGVSDYTNLPGEDSVIVYSNSPGGLVPVYFRGQVWLVE